MPDDKESVYRSLRGEFHGFILTIAVFVKGIVTALLFAWIISWVPSLARLIGIAENNPAAQVVMIAGDITSVIYALLKLLEDLEIRSRS
jgi:hypothetical protein